MSASGDNILQEMRPIEPLIPTLDGSLELSEKQIKFLHHAIRDLNLDTVDAEAEIRRRVLEIRSRAYEVFPYPCIRGFHYVYLLMAENDAFSYILKVGTRQANAPLLLDVGCCMGTDLRHLVQSGYPSSSVIGCDLRQGFIDLGHALYGDRDTCQIPFFAADIFDITLCPFPQAADKAGPPLKDVRHLDELVGRVKYIYTGALFHLFDEGTQEAVARRLVTLLDVTEGSGPAVLFGRHCAKIEEGIISDDALGHIRYAHSPASWGKLWERVLGGNLKVPVRVDTGLCFDHGKISGAKRWWKLSKDTETMFWSVWVG